MSDALRIDADKIAHELARLGLDWADKNAAASSLEETRKTVRAKLAKDGAAFGSSVARAELEAEASSEYADHIKSMVEARRVADRARVLYDTARVKAELIRSNASTERALAGMR